MNKVNFLTTGDDNPLLPELLEVLGKASEIEVAVAFVKKSGLELIFSALVDALQLDETTGFARAKLKIITTDYLNISDPAAYRMLMLLQERGADVKVYSNHKKSFHMKAYICVRKINEANLETNAFIGSSNITKSALTDGLEWNYRVFCNHNSDKQQQENVKKIREEFNNLFTNNFSLNLTHDWITAYSIRKESSADIIFADFPVEEPQKPIEPNPIQVQALNALQETRKIGYVRGLAVLATGLGKTWLSALDAKQMGAKKILFVAHRQEILIQAEQTFLKINPESKVGFYNANNKEIKADIICASVQTLGKQTYLDQFNPEYFEYIIVDEFHHANAKTYRNIINYFKPKFLLGLTATPHRTDNADIFSLCDDNVVFECSLFEGIDQNLLSPFNYFGIFDETIDYREIPWRNSEFDPKQLEHELVTFKRAKHVEKSWRLHGQKRTLAFCISKKHADFMSNAFNSWGIKSVSCHGDSSTTRTEALSLLDTSQIDIVFSVDLFNEGVDLPSIDTVMMLRPTSSKVLFLQQLGRGLRKSELKESLNVLDFIGNHTSFFNKQQALFSVQSTTLEIKEWARSYKKGVLKLPKGCFMNYDLQYIDFLEELESNSKDKIVEHYQNLLLTLNRRPTLSEAHLDGISVTNVRKTFGSWFQFISIQTGFSAADLEKYNTVLQKYADFFLEVEKTAIQRCFKMIVLEALIENNGFIDYPSINELCKQSLQVFERRRNCIKDLKVNFQNIETINFKSWVSYWKSNPIKAWGAGNKSSTAKRYFITDETFRPNFLIDKADLEIFTIMLQELIDYRFLRYWERDHDLLSVKVAESGGKYSA